MPSSPEVPDSPGQVGFLKIPGQADAEQPRTAHGNLGIPRKIIVNLQSEQDAAEKNAHAVGMLEGKDTVDHGCEKICQTDFPEKSAQQETPAGSQILRVPSSLCSQLRHQIPGLLDRACDQLREKRHKQRKAEEVPLRTLLTPVDIQHAGYGLERIKRNADRQNDPGQPRQCLLPRPANQTGQGCRCKKQIFAHKQRCKRQDQQYGKQALGSVFFHQQAPGIAQRCYRKEQKKERRAPSHIKQTAGHEKQDIAVPRRADPVQKHRQGQKQQESPGSKAHGFPLLSCMQSMIRRTAAIPVPAVIRLSPSSTQTPTAPQVNKTQRKDKSSLPFPMTLPSSGITAARANRNQKSFTAFVLPLMNQMITAQCGHWRSASH